MSEVRNTSSTPRYSAVWIIPLAAMLIGAWLVYSNLASRGPTITLKLADAEGISAGKTAVKTRNVQVGTVDSVALSEDLSHTLLTVHMEAGTERMLTSSTQFWVVKPRVGREGISGLTTVLSGVYIELVPGEGGAAADTYTVNDSSPPEETGDGLFLQLVSKAGSDIDTGDPVNFRSLRVGRVVATEFDPVEKIFHHRLFIEKPYDVLVTQNCRFWQVSGLGFRLDTQGFEAHIGSLESFLGGGVAFAVPDPTMSAGEQARDGDTFTLYDDEDSARRALYSLTLDYVLLVEGTVRGLRPGAPVEFRGVRVGTVEKVAWGFGYEGPHSIREEPVPVLIRFEPQRLARRTQVEMDQWQREVADMIDNGLRASLKPGNLLTGSLYVDLDFYPDKPVAASLGRYRSIPVFPSIESRTGGLRKIEAQLNELLTTLNGLPFEATANNMNTSIESVTRASQKLEDVLSDPSLSQVSQEALNTMAALQDALKGWQGGQEGEAYARVQETLQKLNQLMDDAAPVIETLNARPNALIFQGSPIPDPQPRATR